MEYLYDVKPLPVPASGIGIGFICFALSIVLTREIVEQNDHL